MSRAQKPLFVTIAPSGTPANLRFQIGLMCQRQLGLDMPLDMSGVLVPARGPEKPDRRSQREKRRQRHRAV
jgi:hypothetical protein